MTCEKIVYLKKNKNYKNRTKPTIFVGKVRIFRTYK